MKLDKVLSDSEITFIKIVSEKKIDSIFNMTPHLLFVTNNIGIIA